jgi:hypothetical protein
MKPSLTSQWELAHPDDERCPTPGTSLAAHAWRRARGIGRSATRARDNARRAAEGRKQGGRSSRRKGNRIELELVARHRALGIKAERYPLSGATRFRGSSHDIDLYIFGSEAAPAVAEVKGRKNGAGFIQLERWLGEYDLLVLRRNHADPMIVLQWHVWEQLLKRVQR